MQRLIATMLCTSIALTAPTVAFAQDDASSAEQFSTLTQQAAEAYEARDYLTAADLFKEAYALRPVSNILYNIGRIYEDAGEIESAIEYYDKFVVAPNVEQTSRKDALERLKTLREVKKMKDAANAPPVEEKVVEKPVEPAPRPKKSKTARNVGWALVGIGGASLIGSGVFAVLTTSEFSKFEDAQTLEARRAAASSGQMNATLADVLLITGAVTAITGGVLLIASLGGDEAQPTASVSVSPWVGSVWGAGLDVRF